MDRVVHPLLAPRRVGIGRRRLLTLDGCVSHGLAILEPDLRPLRAPLPPMSRLVYARLIRAALIWGFDLPGGTAAWGLLRQFASRAAEVLTRWQTQTAASTGGRYGADRYAFAERLPAALLACVGVDVLADLARQTVTVSDGTTGCRHTWTMWQGTLLSSLLGWQTDGRLPSYEVTATPQPVWTPDRVAVAAWLLPGELWRVLDKDLSRMVWSYIVDPHETLTLLHSLVRDTTTLPIQVVDTLLTQCWRGRLRVNTLPGHVFVLPEATFCVMTQVLKVLAHAGLPPTAAETPADAAGLRPADLLVTLRQARLILPGLVRLTIAPDPTRPRPIILRGFLIPHAVLQARCRQAGTGYGALPWATDPPQVYAARARLTAVSEEEETNHADTLHPG